MARRAASAWISAGEQRAGLLEGGLLAGQHAVHAEKRRAKVGLAAHHRALGRGEDGLARRAQVGLRHVAHVDRDHGQTARLDQLFKGLARGQLGLGGVGRGVVG